MFSDIFGVDIDHKPVLSECPHSSLKWQRAKSKDHMSAYLITTLYLLIEAIPLTLPKKINNEIVQSFLLKKYMHSNNVIHAHRRKWLEQRN